MVAFAGTRKKVPWILAPSLVAFVTQTNARWPDRDQTSDGSIGDERHAALKSEHNPQPVAGMARFPEIVCAVDIDVDLDNDPNSPNAPEVSQVLAACFQHESVNYVIYDRKIYQRKYQFRPVPYTGTNPHTGHIHVSVLPYVGAVTSTEPWYPNIPEVDDMPYTPEQLQQIIGDMPIVNKWGQTHKLRDILAAVDFNVVGLGGHLDQALEATADNLTAELPGLTADALLDHRVKAMDPATGKAADISVTQAITRASEATILRQSEGIDNAKDVGTSTELLQALLAERDPQTGKLVAKDPRKS